MVRQPSSIIRFTSIILFCLALYVTVSIWITPKLMGTNNDHLTALIDSLKYAKPEFEVGYGIMELSQFQRMRQANNSSEYELFFPTINNDITKRLETDSPAVQLDYKNMVLDGSQLKLREIGVGCLIIKQIGRGVANDTRLLTKNCSLSGLLDIYDGTDVGGYLEDDSIPKRDEAIMLGTMNTGDAYLVPLYLTNFLDRSEPGGDPPGWQLITCKLLIPCYLVYQHNAIIDSIQISDVLSRPIDIR